MTGKEFREFRLSLGMTQTEFGARMGYKFPQIRISEIENGWRHVPKRVEKLCKEIYDALEKHAEVKKS